MERKLHMIGKQRILIDFATLCIVLSIINLRYFSITWINYVLAASTMLAIQAYAFYVQNSIDKIYQDQKNIKFEISQMNARNDIMRNRYLS